MAGHIATPTTRGQSYNTPEYLVEDIRKLMGTIQLDPCSNPTSIVKAVTNYSLPIHDGLTRNWSHNTIFINPPFNRTRLYLPTNNLLDEDTYKKLDDNEKLKCRTNTLYDWVYKAATSTVGVYGKRTTLLVPACVDTKVWQNIIWSDFANHDNAILFFKGRLKFLGAKQFAPMAMSLVYYCPNFEDQMRFHSIFNKYGRVLTSGSR